MTGSAAVNAELAAANAELEAVNAGLAAVRAELAAVNAALVAVSAGLVAVSAEFEAVCVDVAVPVVGPSAAAYERRQLLQELVAAFAAGPARPWPVPPLV